MILNKSYHSMVGHLLAFVALIVCVSCSHEPNTVTVNSQSAGFKPGVNCAASPPIMDRSRLVVMLINNGTISSDLNKEERERIVNEFIHQKYTAHKDCK